MFESISRGWALTKTSFRVLKLDKEILLLPVLSALTMIALIVAGMVTLTTGSLAVGGTDAGQALFWLTLFGFYVVGYFVVLFFNAAVIECAMIRFNGGDPVVRDGLRKAWSRKGRILQWAVVAATVGLLLNLLRQAMRNQESPVARIVGSIFAWIVEAAWYIVAFFVMPILIYEDVGPIDALKRSWGTVKRAGGEGFVGMFAVNGLFFVGFLVAAGVSFLIAWLGGFAFGAVAVAIGLFVVVAAALSVVQSALQGILVAAAYKYVQDGRLPVAFDQASQAIGVPPVVPQ